MGSDVITEGAEAARTNGRRGAGQAKRKVASQAARSSADVIVALERAQQAALGLGDRAARQGERAYQQGERAARAAARKIGERPWRAALLLGGALLAGAASAYLLETARRR